jgi:hypothetical protein
VVSPAWEELQAAYLARLACTDRDIAAGVAQQAIEDTATTLAAALRDGDCPVLKGLDEQTRAKLSKKADRENSGGTVYPPH